MLKVNIENDNTTIYKFNVHNFEQPERHTTGFGSHLMSQMHIKFNICQLNKSQQPVVMAFMTIIIIKLFDLDNEHMKLKVKWEKERRQR